MMKSFFERFLIACQDDPVKYAMRICVILGVALFLALVVRNARSAEPIGIKCNNGVCTISQDQLFILLRLIRMPCVTAI
jgi:hypothetical protein